jgi:single-strand DNA-binding protein
MTINKVILIGNAGKDPETMTFSDGSFKIRFPIATHERWRDKNDEMQERTEWHNIVAKGQRADFGRKYIKKGSQVYVEGKIRTRSYEDETNTTRWITEVVCRELILLGKKDSENADPPDKELPF